jgi:AcrR family transcriptional regulator
MSDAQSQPQRRPLRSDARVSRAALLAAARELVAERGPEALTVVSVAKRAGLNRSTAYQHFRSRDQLIRAVAAGFAADLAQMFQQPRPLGEQVDFFVQHFLDNPDIARIWMFQLLNGNGDIGSGWDDFVTALERLAKSPRSQNDIDAEMLGVIGMTSALVWSLMAKQRSQSEDEARVLGQRFSRELKRLFLFGALRPEGWTELADSVDEASPEG